MPARLRCTTYHGSLEYHHQRSVDPFPHTHDYEIQSHAEAVGPDLPILCTEMVTDI